MKEDLVIGMKTISKNLYRFNKVAEFDFIDIEKRLKELKELEKKLVKEIELFKSK